MKGLKVIVVLAALAAMLVIGSTGVLAAEKITVAYFPGWPGTFEVGWAKGMFEKEMGVEVNWREFDTGAQMTAAMASGDVVISYAIGSIPFTSAVTQGVPLKMVAISESYSEAENLVVRDDSGITKPEDLIGKKVATPFGTTSHYRLMGILEMFNLDESKIKIIDMAGADIVAAFRRGDIDAGCAWEPAVSEMIKFGGRVIVPAEDQIKAGYATYGLVAVTDDFAKKNPDMVKKFLKVMNESTEFFRANPGEAYKLIGEKAGLTPEKTKDIMASMGFYSRDEQLSSTWLGAPGQIGNVAKNIKKVADFLVKQQAIDKALDSYEKFIDPSYMEAAK
jgi:taurine transport system substrate-binding protein